MRLQGLMIGLAIMLIAADDEQDKAAKKDLEQMRGSWVAVKYVVGGKAATEQTFRAAADAALAGAKAQEQNGFKIELARRALVRALTDLAGGAA